FLSFLIKSRVVCIIAKIFIFDFAQYAQSGLSSIFKSKNSILGDTNEIFQAIFISVQEKSIFFR
ncbi:hypothetical protein HOK00_11425, partial [bacterium]|nr:hypothetical protein [bacterium]